MPAPPGAANGIRRATVDLYPVPTRFQAANCPVLLWLPAGPSNRAGNAWTADRLSPVRSPIAGANSGSVPAVLAQPQDTQRVHGAPDHLPRMRTDISRKPGR